MSSRDQSPEIGLHDENGVLNSPDITQRSLGAAEPKSYEGSAAHHVDAEATIIGVQETKHVNTLNGKSTRTSGLDALVKSDSQDPLPTVSQLRPSASQNRPSAMQSRLSPSNNGATAAASEVRANGKNCNHNNLTSPSQARLSGATVRNSASSATAGRPPAVPPLALHQQPLQPSQSQSSLRPSVARVPLKAPSASLPRAAASFSSGRRPSGGSKAFMPKVLTAAPNYGAYAPDVAKYLKEVVRRRDEAASLKLLPSAQLLEQAVLQEQAAHEQILQQQVLAFMQITHKRREAEAKMKEQQTTKAYKAKVEEQKQQHKEEMMQLKTTVAESMKEIETDVKEKLKLLVLLQPRLNIVQAVMAQIQDPASDCAILGELMQEDKQLQKALKGDARYNNSSTAEMDGGALPYWWKQCVCASFNIAAIIKGESLRASVVSVSLPTKVAADKKVVAVKDADGSVVAWAHTRTGPDTNALVEAFVEAKPVVVELPASAYKGVLWPKDDSVEVLRAAKVANSAAAAMAPEVITILAHKEVGSFELPKKDVVAAGMAAA